MLYRRIIILIVIASFWLTLSKAEVQADWGDVVDVNYSLWTDAAHTQPVQGNIDQTLEYIYLSQGSTVPSSISALFPSANAAYLLKFKEAIIGLAVGEEKNFMIAKEDPYGDQDLYYNIRLLKIHYDASGPEDSTSSSSETTTTTKQSSIGDLIGPVTLGGGAVIGIVGFVMWNIQSAKKKKAIISSKISSDAIRENDIKKQKDKIKELRELTKTFDKPVEKSGQKELKFRRRK
ncbi:MAG: hypothetical protein ACTSR2_10495 [Candidatus Hodarchaeales archaeon]